MAEHFLHIGARSYQWMMPVFWALEGRAGLAESVCLDRLSWGSQDMGQWGGGTPELQ